eukprot:CAMPEP_0197589666 /NCGR_PEP_ID=MMETSP1326-20131121/10533_1 /TAXON_ID=1155430 /ORGANISM="Genus nov. species nov., Strain RCC2288" /LENGTH=167 /DNA_ID=CAMNT_0043154627 /DNA_START=39 /DNA_END=542 /DNA_ORIENTATION=+
MAAMFAQSSFLGASVKAQAAPSSRARKQATSPVAFFKPKEPAAPAKKKGGFAGFGAKPAAPAKEEKKEGGFFGFGAKPAAAPAKGKGAAPKQLAKGKGGGAEEGASFKGPVDFAIKLLKPLDNVYQVLPGYNKMADKIDGKSKGWAFPVFKGSSYNKSFKEQINTRK